MSIKTCIIFTNNIYTFLCLIVTNAVYMCGKSMCSVKRIAATSCKSLVLITNLIWHVLGTDGAVKQKSVPVMGYTS